MSLFETLRQRRASPRSNQDVLLKSLHRMREEGKRHRNKCHSPDQIDSDLALYRGKARPADADARNVFFAGNFIQTFLNRQVARLTDNRPIIRIGPRKAGLTNVANLLNKVLMSEWDAQCMQRQTYKMAHTAGIMGSAGMYLGWDAIEGEQFIEILSPDRIMIDPRVTEAALIDRAEYVIIEFVRSLDDLRLRFPGVGSLVKSDAEISVESSRVNPSVRSPTLESFLGQSDTSKTTSSVVPSARVWEAYLIDRSLDDDLNRRFPKGRQIIFTREQILSDGRNPFWDGLPPVEWFDWDVDPMHPWGISEPSKLKHIQLSFNQLVDELIRNKLLTNFIRVTGEVDAVSDETWRTIEQFVPGGSMIIPLLSQNKRIDIQPPPAFGGDDLRIAQQIFTFAQLLTGQTVLGDNPGSLQSGRAVEGLVEAANEADRSRASRLEDFYTRVGKKLVSRILQFFPSDRVVSLTGPTGEAFDYVIHRSSFFINDENKEATTPEERQQLLRDLEFTVSPGSSQPGTRMARAAQMMQIMRIGGATPTDVLRAADFPNPEEMTQRAAADPMTQKVVEGSNRQRNDRGR